MRISPQSPPLLFRVGSDGEHFCLAFFDGQEIFALDLVNLKDGIYALDAFKWVKVTKKP